MSAPGIFARFLPDVTPEMYRRPSGPPRLSQSLAHTIVDRSPWHAKRDLDRRAPEPEAEGEDESSGEMDRGTIIHACLLGTPSPCVIVADPATREPFKDFRTKAAQAQRDAIRKAGKIPVIAAKVEPILRTADRIRDNLFNDHGIDLTGRSELVVEWSDVTDDGEPISCRGMLDHWLPERATVYDLKIWQSANPRILARKLIDMGVDIQAHAYTSAVEAVHPNLAGRVRFVALICEAGSGLVTPVLMAGSMREHGRSRWRRALHTWARCLRTGEWPGYARGEVHVGVPDWQMAAELDAAADANGRVFETNQRPARKGAGEEIDHGADEREIAEDVF